LCAFVWSCCVTCSASRDVASVSFRGDCTLPIVVVNLFLISYVIGKLLTEQLWRGKLIFLQKSVDFAAFSAKSALFAMKNILFKSLLARGAGGPGSVSLRA